MLLGLENLLEQRMTTPLGNVFHCSTVFIVNTFFLNVKSEPHLFHLRPLFLLSLHLLKQPAFCILNNVPLSTGGCPEFYYIHQKLYMLNKLSFLSFFSFGMCLRPWPCSWSCDGLSSRLPSLFYLGSSGWMYSRCWLMNTEWREVSGE